MLDVKLHRSKIPGMLKLPFLRESARVSIVDAKYDSALKIGQLAEMLIIRKLEA